MKYKNKPTSNIPTSNIKPLTSNSAITLVALVVTIIVLLILAGVTLNMVMGENGIIEKARMAKMETNKAQEDENKKLLDLEEKLEVNTTREENTSQSKRKILFDSETDSNGPITVAGATDGSSERNFSDNVNNYDNILLYVEAIETSSIYPPTIIDKSDFNKNIVYYIGGFSSTCVLASGYVNIDSVNNKIVYISKGHNSQQITKVIGIKY